MPTYVTDYYVENYYTQTASDIVDAIILNNVASIYYGSLQVNKVMVGGQQIWVRP